MNVICNKPNCNMRKGPFCGLDYLAINDFGQCKIWYGKNGQPYMQPVYPEREARSDVKTEDVKKPEEVRTDDAEPQEMKENN